MRADLRDLVRQARATGAQVVLVAIPSPSLLGVLASRLSDDPLYADLARDEGVVGVADAVSAVLSDPALRADRLSAYRQWDLPLPQALHQDVLKASWDAHGLDRVISVDVDPLIRATYGQVLAADPLGYYSSYHGAYAPPFCHASARDLFNQVR